MRFSEAEQCFREEVRTKKLAANGVHGKTGKNGYTGKILFPSDIMSRKEKYNHRKAGKVMTTNLFDEILPIDEFRELETYEQRNRLAYWRTNYSNKEIQEKMGIANSPYYAIVAELGLPKAPRVNKDDKKKKTAKVVAISSSPKEEAQDQYQPAPEPLQEIITNGLHLIFNGTFSSEEIRKKLTKLDVLLDGEENEFHIELKITEK